MYTQLGLSSFHNLPANLFLLLKLAQLIINYNSFTFFFISIIYIRNGELKVIRDSNFRTLSIAGQSMKSKNYVH